MYKRGIFALLIKLTFNSNNAYKVSLIENRNKQLGHNDMNGHLIKYLLINSHCVNYESYLPLLNSGKN